MALPRRTVHRWRELDVVEAVALRDWALTALSSPPDSDAAPRPPVAAPATWELFLEAEACAIPLSRLGHDYTAAPSPEVMAVLQAAATAELRRVLAARAQLRTLGELAARHGIEVVALKGAVSVGAGHDLTLDDIDLLTRPERAEAFAAALDASGHLPTAGGSPRHLGTRVLPGGLGVDVHAWLSETGEPVPEESWSTIQALDGVSGLKRLSPLEHAWHVLTHIAIDHPDRRGRIRDLLLIADALHDCSGAEIQEVERRVLGHSYHMELADLLNMALAIGGKTGPVEDRFRHSWVSACKLRGLLDHLTWPEPLLEKTWRWSVAFLGSAADRRYLWQETTTRNLAVSRYWVIRVVQERMPSLGRAWQLFWRWLRLPGVVTLAAFFAALARFHVERLDL